MSPVSLICIGFLIFSVANGANKGTLKRNRRSLVKLNSMAEGVSGRTGTDYLNYGNWCGLGGSGDPVDPIDGCCQSHDFCYDEVSETYCLGYKKNAVYTVNYEWSITKNGTVTCGEGEDACASACCLCDVVLINCLKANDHLYDRKKLKPLDLYEILEQTNLLTNL